MGKKQWYIVRHKKEKRWTAYELTKEELDSLKKGYVQKGPYKSLVAALIAANE